MCLDEALIGRERARCLINAQKHPFWKAIPCFGVERGVGACSQSVQLLRCVCVRCWCVTGATGCCTGWGSTVIRSSISNGGFAALGLAETFGNQRSNPPFQAHPFVLSFVSLKPARACTHSSTPCPGSKAQKEGMTSPRVLSGLHCLLSHILKY